MADRNPHIEEPADEAKQPSGDEQDASAQQPPTYADVLRYALYGLGGLLGLVLVVVLVVLLLLQTPWGARTVKDIAVNQINKNVLQEGATLHVDRLAGNFITRLQIYDARLVDSTGTTMVQIDTASARYSLGRLLQKKIALREIDVANPSVRMEQQPDSSWDLLNALPSDTTQQQAAFSLLVDELALRNGRLRASFYQPTSDSLLQGRDLNVKLSNLESGDELAVSADTLWGRLTPPGTTDEMLLEGSGRLAENQLTLDGLRLTSPRSKLLARGTLRLPEEDGQPLEDIDFTLTADPISFRDLTPFAPSLNPDAQGVINAQARGTSQLLSVEAQARFANGSSLALNGQLTPSATDSLTYQLEAEARQLAPGYFMAGGDSTTRVNADASLDVTGSQLSTLNGTARARLFDSSIGQQQIREATLRSNFTDGRADFELRGQLRGGALAADGTGRFFDDVPTYDVAGRFDQVDLGALTQNPQQQSTLNGRFAVEGRGTNPETADLSANLALVNSTLNDQPIEEARADLSLESGQLAFNTSFRSPAGRLVLRGEGTFQGGTATYRLYEGRFENVNVAGFTGTPADSSRLTGTFTAEGRGLSLDELALDARLRIAEGYYGTYQIQNALFDLDGQNQTLTFDGRANLAGGSFYLAGTVHLVEPLPAYNIEGQFENVRIGALTQNPQQQSNLNGTFTLDGRGFSPQQARLTARLALNNSTLNKKQINEGTAYLTLRGGDFSFNTTFRSPSGTLAVQSGGAIRNGNIGYRIYEGRFENVDLATFTGNPDNTSDLTGTFTATGWGTNLATLTLDAQLNLESSRFNQQDIEQGTLAVNLQRGALDFNADVRTPDGRLLFEGGGDLSGESMSVALREGTFEGFNIGALLNNPNLQSDLNGRITLDGQALNLKQRTFEGTLTLRSSTFNEANIQEGRITANVREGAGSAEGRINFAEGQAAFDAQFNLTGPSPRYDVSGSLANVDLGALLNNDSLSTLAALNVELAGQGTDLQTMELRGRVTAESAAYQTAQIDSIRTSFALDDGMLQVDTLLVRTNFADLTGGGRLALFDPQKNRTSDFSFQANVEELGPIRPVLSVQTLALNEGHFEGRAFGPAGTLRIETEVRLNSLVYNQIRLADFQGRLAGQFDTDSTRTLEVGELRAEAAYLSVPQLTVQNTHVEALYENDEATFSVDMTVDERRDMQLTGTVDLRPEHQRLQIDSLQMRIDKDQWQLLQPASVTYGDEYRVSNLLLYSDDQQIAVDGVVDPDGMQNLVLTIENFRIGAVADLFDYQGLGGSLSGSINLTGPAEAPEAEGTLLLDLSSYNEAVGNLRLALNYAEQQLNIDALLTHRDESTLQIDGFVPVDLRLTSAEQTTGQAPGVQLQTSQAVSGSEVNLTVQADSFSIDWARPFLDPETVTAFQGRLSADVDVSGTLGSPVLNGQARFTDGRIGLTQIGTAYRNIRAEATLERNQVIVDSFEMRSGDGTMSGDGTIDLADLTLGEFNLDARMDDFQAIDTRQQQAVLGGNLTLRGTTREPVLRGNVDVQGADIYIGESSNSANLENVSLTQDDVQMLERNFGFRLSQADTITFDFYNALDMQLDVEIERNVWVRSRANPDMSIQFTGQLDLSKQPNQEAQAFGTIEVIEERSYVEQFGKRFTLTDGTLRFNGPVSDPLLNVEAQYDVGAVSNRRQNAVTITLSLSGRLDDLEVDLSSNPPLDNANIVSYIATGQPAGGQLGELGQLGTLGQNVALGQLTGIIEGVAGEELGLDVFQINPTGTSATNYSGPSLTAGKYVTGRLFAGIEQPLSPDATTATTNQGVNTGTIITLEYELLEWLLARLSQQGSKFQIDLFWEYSY